MSKSYGLLYQTFSSSDTPTEDLTVSQKCELKKNLENLNQEQNKAVFYLIIEHAKITENYIYDQETKIFPYDMYQDGLSMKFYLEKLPVNLKWILWKFNNLIVNQNEK